MSFDNWKTRLEIAKLPTVAARRAAINALDPKINFEKPYPEDEGYYRKPVTVKDPKGNGKNIIVDWIPVAYYIYGGKLVGDFGDKQMTDDEINDVWSWVVSYPIEYETYLAVQNGAPWPDLKPMMIAGDGRAIPAKALLREDGEIELVQASIDSPINLMDALKRSIEPPLDPIERVIGRTHNQPPPEEIVSPEVEHARAVDNAIGAAPKVVTSEAEAAIALGSKNRIGELRLAADKAGKAIYQPLHAAYVKERDKWLPVVNRALKAEGDLQTAILTFRESERKRLLKLAAEEEERQRKAEEEAQRIADRAIIAGVPEPAPVVAPEPPPAIIQPAPIQPTYGKRKLKEELKKFPVVHDWDAIYGHFKESEEVKALLIVLATAAIRAGLAVPGTTTREGLV